MPRRVSVLFWVVLLGCTHTEDSLQSEGVAEIAPVEVQADYQPATANFGGDAWGFVHASSANGRFVVLRTFDGAERPEFGHHGGASAVSRVIVHDLESGDETAVEELIDVAPGRRWFLFVRDANILLLDADNGTWEPLSGVDTGRDANRCLAPRSASFSPGGTRVGWVAADAGSLEVRELGDGTRWSVRAQGRLWRGWPLDDEHAATLLEVAENEQGWPEQQTSCDCRWCGRFALSQGFYGWAGPAFTMSKVGRDGSRSEASGGSGGSDPWHGPTRAGCNLHATSDDGERLEHGPWFWECPGRA